MIRYTALAFLLVQPLLSQGLQAQTALPKGAAIGDVADNVPSKGASDGAKFSCPALIAPVTSLNHGSRYTVSDKSRSALDDITNAEVDAQLDPVDDFITNMILAANAAITPPEASLETLPETLPETPPEILAITPPDGMPNTLAVACVKDGLLAWAQAGALQDIGSLNANLSVPGRVAGLAYAWVQIKPMVQDQSSAQVIEAWLAGLARATMVFFDTQAPPMSAQNNLRAWAGLSVALVGTALGDKPMTDWAAASTVLVACQALPDGSLPHEMTRKHLALHYQLHALSALVTTAAILPSYALFDACDGSLHRSVDFAVSAFDDAGAVTARAGVAQSYFTGAETLRGFEIAWAAAYLSLFPSPKIASFAAQFDSLANSKLGGLQSLLWAKGA